MVAAAGVVMVAAAGVVEGRELGVVDTAGRMLVTLETLDSPRTKRTGIFVELTSIPSSNSALQCILVMLKFTGRFEKVSVAAPNTALKEVSTLVVSSTRDPFLNHCIPITFIRLTAVCKQVNLARSPWLAIRRSVGRTLTS